MFNENAIQKAVDLLRDSSDSDINQFVESLKSILGQIDNGNDFDKLPGIIKIQDEAVSIIGDLDNNPILHASNNSILQTVSLFLPYIKQKIDNPQRPVVEYTPIYDLYLVKRNNIISKKPHNIVNAGEYFHIGRPREHGLPRFPAIATKLIDGKHIQVHKYDNKIKVFDRNGVDFAGNTPILSDILLHLWKMDNPKSIVFNAIFDKDALYIIDLLLYNNDKRAYLLPYKKRISIINDINWCDNAGFIDYIVVNNEQEINDKLVFGKWMLRWDEEKVNISRPHWYVCNILKDIDNQHVIDELFSQDFGDAAYECVISNDMITINELNIELPMYTDVFDFKNGDIKDKIVFGVQSLDSNNRSSHEFFLVENNIGRYVYVSNGKLIKCPTDMPYVLWINEKFSMVNLNISHIDTLLEYDWESIPSNYESIINEKEDLYYNFE